jgi:hypothetical protein
LCAPNSKTEVHLSIRGPYNRRKDQREVDEWNSLIENRSIKVNEVGNFFLYNQNTVFLKCSSPIILKVWDKSGYAFMPHLTLYDGNDQLFATELYDLLREFPIDISFKSSGVVLYDTTKLNATALLKLGINNDIINTILGEDWRAINPSNCTTEQKLSYVKKCFSEISNTFAVSH